jgi:IclR family KDG regulon transcriptional repressor
MGKPIKVVVKTFKMIELLDTEKGLNLTDLSLRASLPKPTTYRILDTLAGLGYVEHDPATHRFTLGSRFLTFIRNSGPGSDLISLAEPYMEKLGKLCGETVNLARLIDYQIIYIRILESDHVFRISNNVGDRASVHSTAIGKAIASFLPKEDLDEVLRRNVYTPFTRKTIVGEASLRRHLALVRKRGYAIDDEEGHDGVLCVGAPIFNKSHAPFAGLSVSMPKVRAKEKILSTIFRELPKLAVQLSLDLGVTDIRKCFADETPVAGQQNRS